MKSLKSIGRSGIDYLSANEFWKKYDAGEFGKPVASAKPWESSAFQQWIKATQAMPAETQVEAVSKKLIELNLGFDGKITGYDGKGAPNIEHGRVISFGFCADNVDDISPVQVLAGLKELRCAGSTWKSGKLADLSSLQGMSLRNLNCNSTAVSSLSPLKGMSLHNLACGDTAVADLAPLAGMPLESLWCIKTPITDLAPLAGMPLVELRCELSRVADLSPLRGLPLNFLSIDGAPVIDLSPIKGAPLRVLWCERTQVSDLLPLRGMPLAELYIQGTLVSDLSPLSECKSLNVLRATSTKVTLANAVALQKSLPNCKIECDDPSKTKSP
jgi:hypothetical protein